MKLFTKKLQLTSINYRLTHSPQETLTELRQTPNIGLVVIECDAHTPQIEQLINAIPQHLPCILISPSAHCQSLPNHIHPMQASTTPRELFMLAHQLMDGATSRR